MSEEKSMKILENVLESVNEKTESCKLLIKDEEVNLYCPQDATQDQKKSDLNKLIRNLSVKTIFDDDANRHRKNILKILRAKRKTEIEGISSQVL